SPVTLIAWAAEETIIMPASAIKMLFFIIYSIQKIKIKEVPKKPENSTAHPSGINDLAK
ncbi:TPA: hypothetical protein L9139_000001, partial [Klebsiella pneumoniae]|nr:hypothetical protein [Klebsiella pneumoniae]